MNKRLLARAWFFAAAVTSSISSPLGAHAQIIPEYLKTVVSKHAPILIAETAGEVPNVEAKDHILRVDFDGNTNGWDNYDNAFDPSRVLNGEPIVYYSAIETGQSSSDGYYFLGYYIYHPQDGGASFYSTGANWVYHGHEHDMEGVYFIVHKNPYTPYGDLLAALTEAHGALIPFDNPDYYFPDPAGDNWMGNVRYWYDYTFSTNRPVGVIRSRTHGTYMAQDCSGATPQRDLPPGRGSSFGMWLESPQQFGTYRACIHGGTNLLIYMPVPATYAPSSGYSPQRLGPDTRGGTFLYGLTELANSPIWNLRNTLGLLVGSVVGIGYGTYGYDGFYYSGSDHDGVVDPNETGNTPWQWQGGTGECHHDIQYECWYSFGMDGTGFWDGRRHWPKAPTTGRLLGNPEAEMQMRFPFISGWGGNFVYNPYVTDGSPPPPAELSVNMTGPDGGTQDLQYTWTAQVAGGTPPYTYQWGGVMGSGTGSVFTRTLQASGDLYLDVWDAAGTHIAVSRWIEAVQNCGGLAC